MNLCLKIVIVLLAFYSSLIFAENWTRIYQREINGSIHTVLIDIDSISREGQLITAWTKSNAADHLGLDFVQVSCTESSVKYNSATVFRDGTIKTNIQKGFFKFPLNEPTIGFEIYKRFC
jgi:hypothetical protein